MALAQKDDKIASIEAIPAKYITDAERHLLIERARMGSDVHAFPAAVQAESAKGLWRVWDVDTSMLLPPLLSAWQILSMLHGSGAGWRIICERGIAGQQRRDVNIVVPVNTALDRSHYGYMDRAERVIRSLVAYCGAMDIDPAKYEGTHHG